MNKLRNIWDYSQPEFYHFSEDSIILAKCATEILKFYNLNQVKLMDLCAGCGVIGTEMILLTQKQLMVDAVDCQLEFEKSFKENVAQLYELGERCRFILENFKNIPGKHEYKSKYDLVVSNPPYFSSSSNRLGECSKRNISRFFINGTEIDFFKTLFWTTRIGGKMIFSFRDYQPDDWVQIASEMNCRIHVELLSIKSETSFVVMSMIDKN